MSEMKLRPSKGRTVLAKKRLVWGGMAILAQVTITEEQWDYLHSLPEGLTISRVIREAIKLYQKEHEKDLDKFK